MFNKINLPLRLQSALLTSLLCFVSFTMSFAEQGKDNITSPPSSPASYTCLFTDTPIQLDGVLDEPAWKRADKLIINTVYRPKNPPFLPLTTVRLLWSDKMLYVSFECADDDIYSYSSQADDPLYFGDVVELFIKPSTQNFSYYEFITAPNGTLFDARYPSRGAGGARRFSKWNSAATTATKLNGTDNHWQDTDHGYTVEIAIPLDAFTETPRPAQNVVWTFGAFRYDFSKSYEEPLLLMSLAEAPSHGFHYYEGYQQLRFERGKP